jgi:uncharacterized alkaline shock family protein YloU
MKALGILIVFICTIAFAVIGGLLIAFAFNLFTMQSMMAFLQQTFHLQNMQGIIFGVGAFLIISSIFIAHVSLGKIQREKTIAFNNPDGQVTVSLAAIEDYVRRLSSNMSEIKDLRSHVIAGKKGIEINSRVSLWADSNIPQSTENIQGVIKTRIQEMLGIDEPIIVRVHVGKIVPKEKKRPKKKEKDKEEKPLPFRGSIEYGKDLIS